MLVSFRYVQQILNIQTAVLPLARWSYCTTFNWSGVALESSLVRWALLHDQGGRFWKRFHWKTIAKTVRTSKTKSCQLQARGPPSIALHPLWDNARRLGWSACIIHVTTPGDICEVMVFHSRITNRLAEHRMTQPLRIRPSHCLCFCL